MNLLERFGGIFAKRQTEPERHDRAQLVTFSPRSETICRWFGVPPQMIGDTSKQTFANFEQAGLNFLALAVMPWVVRLEQEVNRKLLGKVRGRARPFIKIKTAAVVRTNIEAQYRSFALGRQWGWLSVNDIRRLVDMEPIGSEGDIYLQPASMAPVEPEASDDSEPMRSLAFDRDADGNITTARVISGDAPPRLRAVS